MLNLRQTFAAPAPGALGRREPAAEPSGRNGASGPSESKENETARAAQAKITAKQGAGKRSRKNREEKGGGKRGRKRGGERSTKEPAKRNAIGGGVDRARQNIVERQSSANQDPISKLLDKRRGGRRKASRKPAAKRKPELGQTRANVLKQPTESRRAPPFHATTAGANP